MTEPLFEHRLELGGFETRALELEGNGPPLVLLHGFADSADTWRRTLDLLARRGQRALALDLPGVATAGRLDRAEPVLEQLDRFAAAAIEHAAGDARDPVVVAGNSLGGAIALRAAERADLPLRGIVPVAPAGLDMPTWFRIIELNPVVRWLIASPVPLPEGVVRMAVGEAYRQLAFASPRAAPREWVEAFTSHHRDRRAIARYLAIGRAMLPELADPFRLDRISVPMLLVWGRQDRMVTHRGAQRILDEQPGTVYTLIEDCGHCPQVEEAERFVDVLADFLAAPARTVQAAR